MALYTSRGCPSRAAALCFFLVGLCLAEDEELTSNHSCSFLQTALSHPLRHPGVVQDEGQLVGAEEQRIRLKDLGICATNLTQKDFQRPIREVSEAFQEDGWCVFGAQGTWASQCAVSRRTREISSFNSWFEPFYHVYLNGPQATPYTLRLFDNRSVTIRDHTTPLDDLYCFVLGWYSLPRALVVQNFSYLVEVSEKVCKNLEEIVPGYHELSMNDLDRESYFDGPFLKDLAQKGGGFVPEEVVKGMYLHAAAKCNLRGAGKGALCDIGMCAERGCFGQNESELLYTVRGECEKLTS